MIIVVFVLSKFTLSYSDPQQLNYYMSNSRPNSLKEIIAGSSSSH